jgi:uncharacterized coiled-coil DUF342 family protein
MSKLTSNKPTKKQKTEVPEKTQEVDPETLKLFEKLDEIQEKVEVISDEEAKEILQIQQKYFLKMKPVLKERNEVTKKIPGFWKQAVS